MRLVWRVVEFLYICRNRPLSEVWEGLKAFSQLRWCLWRLRRIGVTPVQLNYLLEEVRTKRVRGATGSAAERVSSIMEMLTALNRKDGSSTLPGPTNSRHSSDTI